MSKVEKISVALTHEMAGKVRNAVLDGEYGSASEAVREALREWADKRERAQAEIEYLRKAWETGIASGPGKFANIDEIIAEARGRQKA